MRELLSIIGKLVLIIPAIASVLYIIVEHKKGYVVCKKNLFILTRMVKSLFLQYGAYFKICSKIVIITGLLILVGFGVMKMAIDSHINKAIVYMKFTPPEYENALIELDRAARLDVLGISSAIYHNRAICYMSKADRDYSKAIKDAEKASKIDSNDSMILFLLGALHARRNEMIDALVCLKKSIECCKNDRELKFIKENVAEEYGDHKDVPADLKDNSIYKNLLHRLETANIRTSQKHLQ